jgi:dihydroorotase-like cyclic amidohydrolase
MDLIIRNAAVLNGSELAVVDIGIVGTTIAAISPR